MVLCSEQILKVIIKTYPEYQTTDINVPFMAGFSMYLLNSSLSTAPSAFTSNSALNLGSTNITLTSEVFMAQDLVISTELLGYVPDVTRSLML